MCKHGRTSKPPKQKEGAPLNYCNSRRAALRDRVLNVLCPECICSVFQRLMLFVALGRNRDRVRIGTPQTQEDDCLFRGAGDGHASERAAVQPRCPPESGHGHFHRRRQQALRVKKAVDAHAPTSAKSLAGARCGFRCDCS